MAHTSQHLLSSSISVTSALAITLDPSSKENKIIQGLRQVYDKQFIRWPAHINLSFPFLPISEAKTITPLLSDVIRSIPAFQFTLSSFDYFTHSSSATVFLKPADDEELQRLHCMIHELLPQISDTRGREGPWQPHLTIAQCKNETEAKALIAKIQTTWTPQKIVLRSVEWLSRENTTPFSRFQLFHLDENPGLDISLLDDDKENVVPMNDAQWFQVSPQFGHYIKGTIPVLKGKFGGNGGSKKQKFIFCLDNSGSMSVGELHHSPWATVKKVMKHVHTTCTDLRDSQVLCYAQLIEKMTLNSFVTRTNIEASGQTYFAELFKAMLTCIEMEQKLPAAQQSELVFMVMSDGTDTSSHPHYVQECLARLKTSTGIDTVCHAVGLGQDVDETFLKTIVNLGTCEGTLRYAKNSSNLEQEFVDMFNLLSTSYQTTLTFNGLSKTTSVEITCHRITEGVIEGGSDDNNKVVGSYATVKVDHPIAAATFEVLVPFSTKLDEVKEMTIGGSVNGTASETAVGSINTGIVLTLSLMEHVSNLQRLKAYELTTPQTEIEAANVLREISLIPSRGGSYNERVMMHTLRQELNERFTEWLQLLNKNKSTTFSAASSLKLNALKYEHNFSKARRNRSAAIKTQTNISVAEGLDQKLRALYTKTCRDETVLSELKTLGETNEWQCAVSLTNIDDLFKPDSDIDDILCIGVRVRRSETAIDSPSTGIIVEDFSSTILSLNTFTDCMQRAVLEKGAEAAHGGLNSASGVGGVVDQHNTAYCVVGSAREKINAVIPLYIHPAHFERVKLMKRTWLSSLFLVDPFLYSVNQLSGFVHVLGLAIQLYNKTSFHRKIIDQLARVAASFLQQVDAFPMEEYKKFHLAPYYRQRQHFASLTLPLTMAYLQDYYGGGHSTTTSTPVDDDKKVAVRNTSSSSQLARLVPAVYFEYMKRNVRDQYAASKVEAHTIAQKLLYGNDKEKSVAEAKEKKVSKGSLMDETIDKFHNWFLEQKGIPPQIPKTLWSFEKKINVPTIIDHCDTTVLEHKKPVPKFMEMFLASVYHLHHGVSTGTSVETTTNPLLTVLQSIPLEQLRMELLIDYFHHNETPAETVTGTSIMELAHAKFLTDFNNRANGEEKSQETQLLANIIADTGDVYAFAGMLRTCCANRNGPVFEQIILNLIRNNEVDKLEIIMSNHVDDDDILLFPNEMDHYVWLPTSVTTFKAICSQLGETKLKEIERQHIQKGRSCRHIYRDYKPNRHNHSNENPYLPLRYHFSGYSRAFATQHI